MSNLDYVKNVRGLKFVEKGMQVRVGDKFGVIIGGNDTGNIDVKFNGNTWSDNCHPTYDIIYFDKDGKVLADYRE